MNRLTRIVYRTLGIGLVAGLLVVSTGCDSVAAAQQNDPAASDELSAAARSLARDLDLSPEAAARLQASLTAYQDQAREPGYLWRVAADLQERLDDEEKERLFAAAESRPPRRPQAGRRDRAFRDRQPGRHAGFLADSLNLTDEQKAGIASIRETYRDRFQELARARREGTVPPDDARARMQELRDTMRAEVEALLTDEQKAQLAGRRAQARDRFDERRVRREAFREEARAVRIEVLGLTAEQQEALEALREAQRAERQELRGSFRSGNAGRGEQGNAFRELRQARDAALADILTPEQLEIVKIHDALAHRAMKSRAPHHRKRG